MRQSPGSRRLVALFRRAAFALLVSTAAVSPGGELSPYTGEPTPPAAELKDAGGQPHSLSDYRGKLVLVNFWASWCGPCVTEIPSLRSLYRKLAGDGLEVLAVNVEEGPFKVHKFRQLVEMPFPVLLDPDGAVFRAWGAKVLPTSFLVDAEGRIRYRVQGPLDWESDETVATVAGLLPGAAAP